MIESRVALVTGGARGIGLGIAEALGAEGYALVLCGRTAETGVQPGVEALRNAGGEVLYLEADVSDAADRRDVLDRTRAAFGRLDVLVNNAGVAPVERADILEADEESFERLVRINLQGPYFLTQAVANWMIEQRGERDFAGCIVTVSSISAVVASTNRGDYCITKAGVSMATQLWAVRLAEFGIPVYEVRPGIVETEMTLGVRDRYDRLIEEGLLLQARWGQPRDVGRAVAMLARGELAYSTGAVVPIDGGMLVRRL